MEGAGGTLHCAYDDEVGLSIHGILARYCLGDLASVAASDQRPLQECRVLYGLRLENLTVWRLASDRLMLIFDSIQR
jgi:hypothetical protein